MEGVKLKDASNLLRVVGVIHRDTEGWYQGYHNRPAVYDDVMQQTVGKRFLNFDDAAFSPDLRRFLAERFPEPCRYESAER